MQPFSSSSRPPACDNPYAAPSLLPVEPKDYNLTPEGGVWRQGNLLVVQRGARLPDRCVKSNELTKGRLLRRLQWYPPYVYALLVASIPIGLVAALATRKRMTLEIGVSDRWRAKRWRAIVLAWSLVLLGAALLGAAFLRAGEPSLPLIIGGPAVFAVGALVAAKGARLVEPKKIDHEFVWLRGVHPAYLDALPPFPEDSSAPSTARRS